MVHSSSDIPLRAQSITSKKFGNHPWTAIIMPVLQIKLQN